MYTKKFDYVAYDALSQEQQVFFKNTMLQLVASIETLDAPYANSLAVVKLEEAYMWIGKAIRDAQIKRNGGAALQEERLDS